MEFIKQAVVTAGKRRTNYIYPNGVQRLSTAPVAEIKGGTRPYSFYCNVFEEYND